MSLPHSHLMKTSGDIATTSLYLLLIPINTNSLCVCWGREFGVHIEMEHSVCAGGRGGVIFALIGISSKYKLVDAMYMHDVIILWRHNIIIMTSCMYWLMRPMGRQKHSYLHLYWQSLGSCFTQTIQHKKEILGHVFGLKCMYCVYNKSLEVGIMEVQLC